MPSPEMPMQPMTERQLRTAADAGGVTELTLTAEGADFLLQIATRSGQRAVLSKARSPEPRRFGSPAAAMAVLRSMGLHVGRFDTTRWDPKAKHMNQSRRARADAMRAAHRAAAYDKWLQDELQASIDDPRPSVPFDEVMANVDKQLASLKRKRKKGA